MCARTHQHVKVLEDVVLLSVEQSGELISWEGTLGKDYSYRTHQPHGRLMLLPTKLRLE